MFLRKLITFMKQILQFSNNQYKQQQLFMKKYGSKTINQSINSQLSNQMKIKYKPSKQKINKSCISISSKKQQSIYQRQQDINQIMNFKQQQNKIELHRQQALLQSLAKLKQNTKMDKLHNIAIQAQIRMINISLNSLEKILAQNPNEIDTIKLMRMLLDNLNNKLESHDDLTYEQEQDKVQMIKQGQQQNKNMTTNFSLEQTHQQTSHYESQNLKN